MTVPLPLNLPLVMDSREPLLGAVKMVFEHPEDLSQNLGLLGRYWRIKVWFSQPVKIRTQANYLSNDEKTVTEHVFAGFWTSKDGDLCYNVRHGGRRGFYFDELLQYVIQYELVIKTEKEQAFKSFEQFKAKFDPRFITEAALHSLYDGTSGQHGGKYTPADFHRLTREGMGVVQNFMRQFKSLTDTTDRIYAQRLSSGRPGGTFGRDIRISHQKDAPYIHYSSEYPGCGNGRYGLLANAREFLWLEDD